VAGLFIIYEAVNSLVHPHVVQKLDYGILLVAFTGAINYIMGTLCVKTGRRTNSLVLVASGKHLQTDTYSTLGIIVGLILLYFLKQWWIDSVVAILFAFISLYTGYKIIRSSVAGIMDETDTTLMEKMVSMLNSNREQNWVDLHNLRIIKYGGTLHVDCHLTVPWYLNVLEAHEEVEALSSLVKKEFGETLELFVHSDACMEFSCRICSKQDCTVRQHPFQKKIEWTMQNISTDNKHHL
jgi:cation diffusion facilitator family transporter